MSRRTLAGLSVTAVAAALALPATTGSPASAAVPPVTVPPAAAVLSVNRAELHPGDAVPVTGRLQRRDTRTGALLGALPATYRLRVLNEDHSINRVYGPFTTVDGTISQTLPGAATEGVTPTPAEGDREVLAVGVEDVRGLDGRVVSAGTVGAAPVTVAAKTGTLTVLNGFTSHLGWVKPGEGYPLRVLLKNSGPTRTGVAVTLRPVSGMYFRAASAGGRPVPVRGGVVTWRPGTVRGGSVTSPTTLALIVQAQARTTTQDRTVVWKNLSTTATATWSGGRAASTSHGPKVVPPSSEYDSARYGDRPFPVVPIDYVDHKHRTENTGKRIAQVINDPKFKGSTFSLWQEASLGQLFPHGTVPSAGVATRPVKDSDGLRFSVPSPSGTCRGVSQVNPLDGTPLPSYTERVKDGWYQLPGTTDYYGDDKYGTGIAGSLAGVGAIFDIDGACGPTAKAAFDAAVAADPDIDYSDYDTDKDGVVDFFEVIFTGLGGHGVSQGLACDPASPTDPDTCPLGETPPLPYYDNIWPHSSSLEFSYTDETTGQGGYVTHDQLKDLEGRPLFYTDASRTKMTTKKTAIKVFVRVGPYNVNPESALHKASVISHEYGHSLGLPDFYSTGSRETYGDWNLMATDKSQGLDVFSRQELGWIVPQEIRPGTSTVKGWKDSKIDTHRITWRDAKGKPYTLSGSTVHNAEAYTAKLPTKKIVDPSKLKKASPTHVWWSQSGNDFGCAPDGAHNLDIYLPQLAKVPAGTAVTLTFKSMFSIEWDYDYGFVLTGVPGSNGTISSYTSHASQNNTTTPAALNPNQNSCQTKYGNGITGSSSSYSANTQVVDRETGTYPDPQFIADSYDISDLAGKKGVLRFSYATDPGFAGPGWFIDDVKVTAGGKTIYSSTFEKDRGPESPSVYNGGCKEGSAVAARCTRGWQYVDSSVGAPDDRGYYLEMRDRSGFDFNGKGQNDRDPIAFKPGLLLTYTDETHGYGNTGTDDPPAQSPLDANPTKGSETPNLNDAAFTQGDDYSDITGHVDNYTDPSSESGNWEFRNNCLGFTVTKMTGDDIGPDSPTGKGGDLRGDVRFLRRSGCANLDYGYTRPVKGQRAGTVNGQAFPPVARAESKPVRGKAGWFDLSALSSYDDSEDPFQLRYAWDLDGDGKTDATGPVVRAQVAKGATPRLVVTDAAGLSAATSVSSLSGLTPAQQRASDRKASAAQRPQGRAGTLNGVVAGTRRSGGADDHRGLWVLIASVCVLTAGASVALARRRA